MRVLRMKFIALAAFLFCSILTVAAQKTFRELEQLTVNENISTIITASEPITSLMCLRIRLLAILPLTMLSG